MKKNNTSILVVEDDLIVAQSIKTHLTTLGYNVPAMVTHGENAIEKAQEIQPDLVLMDINLPGKMDGIEAANKIRSQFNIPVVYLTAYADDNTLTRAKITEPFGYILKPFGIKELHSTIEMALYKYRTDKRTEHLNRVLRAIRNVDQLITKVKDRDQLIQDACNSLIETHGYHSAWIVCLGDNQEIITAAQAGLQQSFTEFLEQLQQGQQPNCWERVMNQSDLLHFENSNLICTDCILERENRGWSKMVTRLENNQKIYGVIMISLPQEWADDPEERALLAELAGDIAFALHTIHEEERRAQAETALEHSEHRYKQLLESVTDYIYSVKIDNGKSQNTTHGPGCEAVTGYTPGEFQANAYLWYEMIHEEDREQAKKQTEKLIAGEAVPSYEHRIIHKNGTTRWVRNTPVPRYNNNGLLIGYDGLISDITERKLAEEEAKASRDQLESIFRAAPTGIGMVIDRHFTFVNKQLMAMLGYSKEELIEQSARMIYPDEEEYNRVGQIKYNQIEKQGIGTIETKFQTKDNRIIDVLLSSSPIDPQDLSRGVTFTALDITERKQAQEALRQAEIEYRTVADFTYDWETWQNPDGTMRYVSPSCQRITGYIAQEFIDDPELSSKIVVTEDKDKWDAYRHNMAEKPERYEIQFRIERKDGTTCWIEHAGVPVTDEQGTFLGYRASNRDISRRKHAEAEQEKLQDQLLQSQKMEAIGRLTGGIAHDFNNLLTAINGFTELAQHKLPADDPVQDLLKYVLDSGHRAASLVRQLLAFSRKQIIEPKIIHLESLIPDLDQMLRRIIGEDIKIDTNVAPNTWPIKIDPAQIEQVIVNLAVNARDAMPNGGQIKISTDNATLSGDDLAGHPETQPGDYVLLSIRDSGIGMSNDILSNIFEPFFTTKEQGKGTGLGLATVYGIIKQNSGDIWVESREGKGTTFRLYLPRAESPGKPASRTDSPENISQGHETILLTEDDDEVRELTRQILERQGYTVLDTATGEEALHLAKHYAKPIDLLLTDVVMPDINGKVLAEKVLRDRPDVKIIFVSGYPDETIAKHGIIETGTVFLQKPFTASQLAQRVRTTLDSSPSNHEDN
jgi:PAS domain S-box-containing protein